MAKNKRFICILELHPHQLNLHLVQKRLTCTVKTINFLQQSKNAFCMATTNEFYIWSESCKSKHPLQSFESIYYIHERNFICSQYANIS